MTISGIEDFRTQFEIFAVYLLLVAVYISIIILEISE